MAKIYDIILTKFIYEYLKKIIFICICLFIDLDQRAYLYYFNYSEFNLENSDILYFRAYNIFSNQMSLHQPIKTVLL